MPAMMEDYRMQDTVETGNGISENALKLLAAITMVIDHLGAEVFSEITFLRWIGRVSFPIFAYFIYIGCRHTHSHLKYMSRILFLGILCVIVYYLFSSMFYANILITFSLSIGLNGLFKYAAKKHYINGSILFGMALAAAYFLSVILQVDYGFCGVLVPVIPYMTEQSASTKDSRTRIKSELAAFAMGLIFLCANLGGTQFLCLLSLPLLYFYNGEKGRRDMKNFFYLFYPLHFVGIAIIKLAVSF